MGLSVVLAVEEGRISQNACVSLVWPAMVKGSFRTRAGARERERNQLDRETKVQMILKSDSQRPV